MTETALILGARGRFGRAATTAFLDAGWHVVAMTRDGTAPGAHPNLTKIAGDVTDADGLAEAAAGADVIVHAVNLPYTDWEATVPRYTASVIAAARASGATVVIPGNVYVFGPDMPAVLGTETPHAATNPLGRVRITMEQAFRDAGVRTILLRAGDFIEDEATGNWFDLVLTKSLSKGRFVYPGPTDIPHAFAYLPDMARAAAALAGIRDRLPVFADIPFAGLGAVTGKDLAHAVGQVMGRDLTLGGFPWWMIRAGALVNPMWRRIVEMGYLWRTPHQLDPAPLAAHLPGFQMTPLDAVMRAVIDPALQGSTTSTQTNRWSDETTGPEPTKS